MVKAVLWDFGGVITTSPFESFNRYEAERGIPKDFIRMNNADNPHDNAWALFERSEVSIDEFDTLFAEETEKKGHRVPGRDVIALLAGEVRPEMVEALRRINEQLLTGCITNNVRAGTGAGMSRSADQAAAVEKVMKMFQVVIESSKVGVRKPSPEIYQIACEKLGVEPGEAVYLDDLGINLKPAREMGMHTIKVIDPLEAIKELEQAVGFPLR
ncbi:MAG: HAD-IA family hydrolase [Alphaproteobacteria bacterium]|nr:HAD-IA family hydrolase [Alphaproteobacteria bacterium]